MNPLQLVNTSCYSNCTQPYFPNGACNRIDFKNITKLVLPFFHNTRVCNQSYQSICSKDQKRLRSLQNVSLFNKNKQEYGCSDLKPGPFGISSFATYAQRLQNSSQADISSFSILSSKDNLIKGEVITTIDNKTFPFSASCEALIYNGFHELRLRFNADPKSKVNNCSGIFNFYDPSRPFAPVMYLGAGSLITSDYNYTLCQGGCYGEIFR